MRRERLGRKAFAGVVVLSLAVALPGLAGADSNASIAATVQIAVPLAGTTSTLQLDFGHLKGDDMSEADGGIDGTVIVDPEPVAKRTATGGASLLGVQTPEGGKFGLAEFTIKGQPDAPYTIGPHTSFPQATSESAPRFLDVIALKSFTINQQKVDAGKLDASGEDVVLVGGTLFVPARIRPGKFVVLESFLLIINY